MTHQDRERDCEVQTLHVQEDYSTELFALRDEPILVTARDQWALERANAPVDVDAVTALLTSRLVGPHCERQMPLVDYSNPNHVLWVSKAQSFPLKEFADISKEIGMVRDERYLGEIIQLSPTLLSLFVCQLLFCEGGCLDAACWLGANG